MTADVQPPGPLHSREARGLVIDQLVWSSTTAALFLPLAHTLDRGSDGAAIVATYSTYAIAVILLRVYWHEPFIAGATRQLVVRPVILTGSCIAALSGCYLALTTGAVIGAAMAVGVLASLVQDAFRYRLLARSSSWALIVDLAWALVGAGFACAVYMGATSKALPVLGWSLGALVSLCVAIFLDRYGGADWGASSNADEDLRLAARIRASGIADAVLTIAVADGLLVVLATILAPDSAVQVRLANSMLGPINSGIQALSVGVLSSRTRLSSKSLAIPIALGALLVGVLAVVSPDRLLAAVFGVEGPGLRLVIMLLAAQRAIGGPARLRITELRREGQVGRIVFARSLSAVFLYLTVVPVSVAGDEGGPIAVCMLVSSVVLWLGLLLGPSQGLSRTARDNGTRYGDRLVR